MGLLSLQSFFCLEIDRIQLVLVLVEELGWGQVEDQELGLVEGQGLELVQVEGQE